MKTFVTAATWTIATILYVSASAFVTAGLWFADREYVHLLDDCVFLHNFTVGDSVVPTFVVSAILVVSGVLVFLSVTRFVNRRETGSSFRINARRILVCCVFIAVGIAAWFAFVDWAGRIVVEALFQSGEVESLDTPPK